MLLSASARKTVKYAQKQYISGSSAGLWIVTVYNIFRKKYSFL